MKKKKQTLAEGLSFKYPTSSLMERIELFLTMQKNKVWLAMHENENVHTLGIELYEPESNPIGGITGDKIYN